MKKSVFIALLSTMVLVLSCNNDDTIVGSGNLISESREVDNFSRFSSSGIFEVDIVQGDTQSVEVTADDNIIGLVRTEVVNNELRLYLDGNSFKQISLSANIVVRNLEGIKNSGTGNIFAADINSTGNFTVFNSGTADINLAGSSESISVINEGSGNFFGFGFEVNDAVVNNSGSGSLEVFCNETLDATLSGSGNVYYRGNPTVNVSISGSGTVTKAD